MKFPIPFPSLFRPAEKPGAGPNKDSLEKTSQDAPPRTIDSATEQPSSLHVHAAARLRALGPASPASELPLPSSEDVQSILDEARQNQQSTPLDLAAALEEKGFRKTLSHLHLSDQDALTLKGLKLSGITFDQCTFDWNHLSEAELTDCRFSRCTFKNVSFANSRLRDCTFADCDFNEAMFLNADLSGVQFLHSTLTNTSFEDARIGGDSRFEHVGMPGTHFLCASVSQTRIRQSKLADTIFFDKQACFDIDEDSLATVTHPPSTATLVSPEARGVSVPLVGEKIANVAKAIPVRVAMQTPAVSKEDVDREVEGILQSFKALPPTDESIPRRLLRTINEHPDDYPNAFAILEKTRLLFRYVHAVALPGGEDISPMLYGEESHGARWNGDFRRSLMELGLIDLRIHHEIPMPFMAICRAFQMLCVYLGVKLNQHIGDDQVGVRVLGEGEADPGDASHTEVFGVDLGGKRIAVYHHQMAPDQELPYMTDKVTRTIKGMEAIMVLAKEGSAPLIALQFHPEFFKKNADTIASDMELTNEALKQFADNYVHPDTGRLGLHDPSDMVKSGVLDYLSPENDRLWEIIGNAAKVRSINREELAQTKEHLHEPANRIQPKRGLKKDIESRIADVLRRQRPAMRASTLTQLKQIASDENQSRSTRKEAEKEIAKRIDPYAGVPTDRAAKTKATGE